jgi:alpha-tubulin suppressor-like RCC1 family protein
MNSFQTFLNESKNNNISTASDSQLNNAIAGEKEEINMETELIICGCVDWENATSKSPFGLDVPHRMSFPSPVKKVFSSSSSLHSFFLLQDNSVYALGRNDHGQLGCGDNNTHYLPILVPLNLNGDYVTKISCGRSHSLLLTNLNRLYVCGSNLFGQLGLGDGKTFCKDFNNFTPLPATDVLDIAAGENHSLYCTTSGLLYAFGHPEYGQLGFGTNGEYIKDGGRGPAVQYHFVVRPKQIENFVVKDNKNKVVQMIHGNHIKIRSVFAGKSHSLCIEDWEDNPTNRVFSWGFGGYGRLGHNCSEDEYYPREILNFSQMNPEKINKQRQVRKIMAGSSYTLAGESDEAC